MVCWYYNKPFFSLLPVLKCIFLLVKCRDLAELYLVKVSCLREQVKRNSGRFSENYMFRLTEEETDLMVSQNTIPSRQQQDDQANRKRIGFNLEGD